MEGGGVARVDGGWKCSELVTVEVEVAELMPAGSARPDGRKGSAERRSPRAARPRPAAPPSLRRGVGANGCGGVEGEKEAAAVERMRRQRGRESLA
jgi:hypothetical protein